MSEHMMKDLSRPKTVAEYARLFFTGFAMGAADIVPGVSGGTIAFISGIYETLLDGIKSLNLDAIKLAIGLKFKALFDHVPVRFFIPLALGLGSAILALSNVLGNLLENQPAFVFAFFGGLILASIISIGLKVTWSIQSAVALVVGAVFAFWVVGLPSIGDASHDPLTLFLSGMVAISAMLLPGISGSFILLILGQYKYVLDAVRGLQIGTLIIFALGCLVGILAFSRIVSYLLKHYESVTIAALTGFMIGAMRTIVERVVNGANAMPNFGAGEALGIALLIGVGFALVTALELVQRRAKTA